MAGAAVRDERKRDPRRDVRAPAPRRHMAQHRVRECAVGISDDLRAPDLRAVLCREADELPRWGVVNAERSSRGLPTHAFAGLTSLPMPRSSAVVDIGLRADDDATFSMRSVLIASVP